MEESYEAELRRIAYKQFVIPEPSISLCQDCLMPEHKGDCQLIDVAAAEVIKGVKP